MTRNRLMRGCHISSAALVVTLALLSGCGSGSSSNQTATPDQTTAFKSSYESVIGQLKGTAVATATAIKQASSKTDAQILVEFRGLASRWQAQLSRLEALEPPTKLAADFNTITSAATRVESDLRAIVSAAATHSVAAAKQATADLVTDILSTKSASAKLQNHL